ncbi:hypothetical protein FRB93_001519 [Tulasnella sp. JGI-2019a]|nr:hypothetical protein FRB93_001519 [Tulasnella sp. JGI-2019a]
MAISGSGAGICQSEADCEGGGPGVKTLCRPSQDDVCFANGQQGALRTSQRRDHSHLTLTIISLGIIGYVFLSFCGLSDFIHQLIPLSPSSFVPARLGIPLALSTIHRFTYLHHPPGHTFTRHSQSSTVICNLSLL